MGRCPHHDPSSRSASPSLDAEELYLAHYNANRRRSVDTGGLALALRDDGSTERTSGKGWGGWDDPQQASIPYAEMLSRLFMQTMPSSCLQTDTSTQHISPATRLRLIRSAGSWAFDPLSLSEGDLFDTTCLIFDVVFAIEGASEDVGIQAHQLRPFLHAMRSVYQHNTYHNYQHAVDVLQAMSVFLVDAGCIPPISILEGSRALVSPKWKRASAPVGTLKDILSHVDVFMLFVAALGHDAGHPGLNNGFMKSAGTCLSAIFDHTSTLERMHCTLLLQLMRNFGLGHLIRSDNIIFGDSISTNIRGALVETVLATDMSLHFKWIKDFNDLIDSRSPLDTTFDTQCEKAKRRVKILACQALMKCADISNPVRPHTISEAWSRALMNEWYAQATLERSMALPSSVPSNVPPPNRPSIFGSEESVTSSPHRHLAPPPAYEDQLEGWDSTEVTAAKEQVKVQVGFIDVFACPLYAALTRFAPELAHFYARCTQNRQLWEAKMSELTELQVELQHANDVAATDSAVVNYHAAQPFPHARSGVVSERDTRSSIDSAQPLFSPSLASDFSFGRRSSTTTTASSVSSVRSGDEEQSDAVEFGSTPKPKTASYTTYFPSVRRDSEELPTSQIYHPPPSSFRQPRHVRNNSIASSVSGVSSYYTARSTASPTGSDHDDVGSWATGAVSAITSLGREGADGWYLSPSVQQSVAFAAHVALSGSAAATHFGGSPVPSIPSPEPEYRAPLGIESMRAAYRASARRNTGSYYEFGGPGPRDSRLIDREYSYRRRSAGNVAPYFRPLTVR